MAEVAVGLAGTGFIATHFAMSVDSSPNHRIRSVLTRRNLATVTGFPHGSVTNSIDQMVGAVDVIVEASGDPIWATEIVAAAVEASKPVVTMNTEFHITTGSAFVGKGLVTEAAGDQPGVLAELHEEGVAMGFEPVAYGNMKGFLNPDPTREEMEFWGEKQGISLQMVTSFTDGTKVQAEQILVANHFGATIAQEGMLGASVESLTEGVDLLASEHERVGRPISDYIVNRDLPHGVFIVARHEERQARALDYYKMGPGPYYTLIRNNIFVHLEILKTIDRVMRRGEVLLDNSAEPGLSLGAVAKRDLEAGREIADGIGSFDVRGLALITANHPDHVPIGLLKRAHLRKDVAVGEILTLTDVELPETLAKELWLDAVSVAQ